MRKSEEEGEDDVMVAHCLTKKKRWREATQ